MDAVEPQAPRRIVICLDGTNNQPDNAHTNVQRIYRAIARLPGAQLTYYQPGVGTLEPIGAATALRRRVLMLADAAGGWMMKRHVCSAYEYLCEVYRPGDALYLFGFSRGAQSARLLAGMLASVGLLHPGMREMVPFAWKTYTSWAPFSALRQLAGAIGRIGENNRRHAYDRRTKNFKDTFSRPVRIRFLGLWDTVSSVGTPWNPRIYNRTDSNADVEVVRHALALDEHRVNFEPKPWRQASPQQDVAEVWFPGVHADIGGGYSGDAIQTAKISLAWMIEAATQAGLQFDPERLQDERLPNFANARAVAKAASRSRHDELQKWRWKLLEVLPFPRWVRNGRQWRLTVWPHFGAHRPLPAGAVLHASVALRMGHDPNYRPSNLPPPPAPEPAPPPPVA